MRKGNLSKQLYISVGDRVNCSSTDFSAILPEEVEQEMKKACEISMGTEVSEIDIINIRYLCDQVRNLYDLRLLFNVTKYLVESVSAIKLMKLLGIV